jgi:hypothetical protein
MQLPNGSENLLVLKGVVHFGDEDACVAEVEL